MKQKSEMENSSKKNNNNNKEDRYLGVAIHSQVRKIKQEMEKIKYPSLEDPEMRPALREITRRQQRSRSPLGLADRPISVGNS
ncbi:uncharacterized protein LOC132302479 [Cornus florida]|uniref:uncharacterized protein LOC132302479 n=1 Tax=Cornus florida TaxID=4283 RepID=UPI0028A2A61D|nr:uncharacterized protein LOC132302479 [Cornus florida]